MCKIQLWNILLFFVKKSIKKILRLSDKSECIGHFYFKASKMYVQVHFFSSFYISLRRPSFSSENG